MDPFPRSKGWIALDGISLTVVDVGEDWFTVSLIPETLKRTIIGNKHEGDPLIWNLTKTPKSSSKPWIQCFRKLKKDSGNP